MLVSDYYYSNCMLNSEIHFGGKLLEELVLLRYEILQT